MLRSAPRTTEIEALGQVVRAVERKLGLALALLAVGIVAILALSFGQPAYQYMMGPEVPLSAAAEGAGCGAHLEWSGVDGPVSQGSRVRFTNETEYWLIPVAIDRRGSDGNWSRIAESPKLRAGESWTHTFWRDGEYRVTSSDDVLRYAGLEREIAVE